MADSDTATIIAKVHERKRRAHDLRNEAHTLMARAAMTGDPALRSEVQTLLLEARSVEHELNELLSKLSPHNGGLPTQTQHRSES